MKANLDRIEREVLGLPETERAFLADRLLSSLGGNFLNDIDAAWVEEAERRYAEYKRGTRQSIPASEVFAEAERLLK